MEIRDSDTQSGRMDPLYYSTINRSGVELKTKRITNEK